MIKAFERASGWPRMVLVSRDPGALGQEAGFTLPIVLDDDWSIAQAFGASGTPAVLLDGRGVVATSVARGSPGVRSALEAIQALAGPVAATDQGVH